MERKKNKRKKNNDSLCSQKDGDFEIAILFRLFSTLFDSLLFFVCLFAKTPHNIKQYLYKLSNASVLLKFFNAKKKERKKENTMYIFALT